MGLSQNEVTEVMDVNSNQIVSVLEYDQLGLILEFDKKEFVLKKIEPISEDPVDQTKTLNYKKSKDIISIKAYIRSLQMKRKETLMS